MGGRKGEEKMMDKQEIEAWISEIDQELKEEMDDWTRGRLLSDRSVLEQVLDRRRIGNPISKSKGASEKSEKECAVIGGGMLTIDPKKIFPGACMIVRVFGEDCAVCKSDDGKIRIFEVFP
jgi:hypothetical protein